MVTWLRSHLEALKNVCVPAEYDWEDRFFEVATLCKSLDAATAVQKCEIRGAAKNEEEWQIAFENYLSKHGFSSQNNYWNVAYKTPYSIKYVSEIGVLSRMNTPVYQIIKATLFNQEALSELIEITSAFLSQPEPRKSGSVYMLGAGMGQLTLHEVGVIQTVFERRNYSPEVLRDYDFVKQELKSASPNGRLTIVEGPPGSGKTHLVKGLISEVDDSIFIYVPSDIVGCLEKPEFVPTLLTINNQHQVPKILVIEDADDILVKRTAENMSKLSALLNATDGIVGELLDIRVLATTNAASVDMDPALHRNGRLLKKLHVGKLDYPQVGELYHHLTGKNWSGDKSPQLLADIYTTARQNGWVPPEREKEQDDEDPED